MLCAIVIGLVCVPVERAEISIHASPVGSEAVVQTGDASAVIELSSDQDVDLRELRRKTCKGDVCINFRAVGNAAGPGRYVLQLELMPRSADEPSVVIFSGSDRPSTIAFASKFKFRVEADGRITLWAMDEFQ